MRILVDTNIILRLTQPTNPAHHDIFAAVTLLRDNGTDLCLVPQVLYEFWVVTTRPIDVNGLGMTPAAAQTSLDVLLDDFLLLRDERGIFKYWFDTVKKYDVRGRGAHDARLVAAMERHGLKHLLTLNVGDFQRYPSINVSAPLDIIDGKVLA